MDVSELLSISYCAGATRAIDQDTGKRFRAPIAVFIEPTRVAAAQIGNPMATGSADMPLQELIEPFLREVGRGKIDIYNEFSLQHELGFFLRNKLLASKVRFERNVSTLFTPSFVFTKREIDICLTSRGDDRLQYAIELKFPRNGQYPEQMFSFCKDVAFAEELKHAGFARAGLIIFAEDPLFWRGPANGIYAIFRSGGGRLLNGAIQKPTGKRDSMVTIRGAYPIEWLSVTDSLRCAAVEAYWDFVSSVCLKDTNDTPPNKLAFKDDG
jgi:hypothetical protein